MDDDLGFCDKRFMEAFRDGHLPTVIFCDGACSGNPGPGGWGAVVATPDGQVVELAGHDPSTTNNRMELTAAMRSLERVAEVDGEVIVYTDSTYVIRGITQWIWGWRQRGWTNAEGQPVANQDLWERLNQVVGRRRGTRSVVWRYVRGHAGVPGNERVDELAVAESMGRRPKLYQGPLSKYSIAVHDLPDGDGALPPMKPKAAKAAAHSYLSLVSGVASRHATWADCERRVKGVSGARFKKALSADDEAEILATWGVQLND